MDNLNTNTFSQEDIRAELWRRGNLAFKLDSLQKDIYENFRACKEKTFVVLCSRRIGKTSTALIIAMEQCLKKPNSVVKFLAPTKVQINDIVESVFPPLIQDCPEKYRPVQLKSKYTYAFYNGSKIQMAGADSGHAEKLRGFAADLCIVDEAGSCTSLINTIRSILLPTTLSTNGKILLLGTAPESVDHEFYKLIEEAEKDETFIKKTIHDSDRYTQEAIKKMAEAYPDGENSPEFRREYLCEVAKDDKSSVLPEFTSQLELEIIKEHIAPPYFDNYVSMDLGGKDLTAVLFGYYDFRASKLIIQDEIAFDFKKEHNTLPKLITEILNKEKELWTSTITGEVKAPYIRVSDINPIVTSEINRASNNALSFTQAKKDDKDAAINTLRVLLQGKQIIISPKCKNLIRHLRNVKWSKNENRREFARSQDNGHYDFVDSLLYFTRAVVMNKNPYPAYYQMDVKNMHIPTSYGQQHSPTVDVFKKIFKRK